MRRPLPIRGVWAAEDGDDVGTKTSILAVVLPECWVGGKLYEMTSSRT